ncbi:alpha-L-fucosidase [Pontiellaceae bacterium B12227]|nr:alpha-L-fucosidase [Pontiellaceae bacterium B12227]
MKLLLSAAVAVSALSVYAEKYEPTWESLAKHEAAPEWLEDAKLGIYFHWGVYCVPAYGNEWYPSKMHIEDDYIYKHHQETYGDPSEFGYHDFVKDFTGQHFDPEEWAELFKKSGARFAGPVAEHHDGYAMWDSKLTPWNAKDTGPHRDILGELFQALEKRDLKTIATFHHARNLQRYADEWDQPGRKWDSHYRYNPKWPTASNDPDLRLLYGNLPEEEWNEKVWLGKLEEVIDAYQPDIIWFDSWLDRIPETYRQRFSSYYLNQAAAWGKEVVIIRKQEDLPLSFSVNDHEKSREPKALPDLWMTDDTISTGSWCYTQDLKVKALYKVVHTLVDTVAKNGVVLLNISPKADGTIPQDQREVLLGLGQWIEVNGEAIYETRPWSIAAEGPTAEPAGGFRDHKKFLTLEYSAKDIRYTASKDGKTVYAFILGVPNNGDRIMMEAFKQAGAKAKKVELMSGGKVSWSNTGKGLRVKMPNLPETDSGTTVLKISL